MRPDNVPPNGGPRTTSDRLDVIARFPGRVVLIIPGFLLFLSGLFALGLLSWEWFGTSSFVRETLPTHLPRTSFVLIAGLAGQFLLFATLARPRGLRGFLARLATLLGAVGLVASLVLLANVDRSPDVLQAAFVVDDEPIRAKLITLVVAFFFSLGTLLVGLRSRPNALPRLARFAATGLVVLAAVLCGLLLQLTATGIVLSGFPDGALNFLLNFAIGSYVLLAIVEVLWGDARAMRDEPGPRRRVQNGAFTVFHAGLLLTGILVGLGLALGGRGLATQAGSSIIKDSRGNVLLVTSIDPAVQWYRLKIPFTKETLFLQQAVVAVEDRSFLTPHHRPVDPLRLASSLLDSTQQLSTEGSVSRMEGGSTITQQVVKMHTNRPLSGLLAGIVEALPGPLARPVAMAGVLADKVIIEMPAACVVELLWSKEEILLYYVNGVYLGEQSYGVEAAAWEYFGIPANRLSRGQAALIAGLPQAPSAYNPRVDLDAAKARQRIVLDTMVRAGFLTRQEAEEIAAEPIELSDQSILHAFSAPHFSHLVEAQVNSRLKGRDVAMVTTTLDPDAQALAERVVKLGVGMYASKAANNAALVAIESRTGYVRALVGSAKAWGDQVDGQYNMVTAERPAASTFKLFVYAAAYEHGYTPDSTIQDTQGVVAGQYIVNWDGLDLGRITLRESLAHSRNPPAVELTEKLGVDTVAEVAHRMGISSDLHEEKLGPLIGLGACSVRMLDLATAYAAVANDGVLQEPVFFTSAQDWRGNTVYSHTPTSGKRVISVEVARAIDSSLSILPREDGFSISAGAKTGTTDDFTDAWFAGYAPDLAIVTWMGRTGEGEGLQPMDNVWGYDGAGAIWRGFVVGHYRVTPNPNVSVATP